MKRPDKIDVQLDLKLLKLAGTWTPNEAERKAAWELYVELATRIAAVTLMFGSLREALSSVYAIFPATRSILRNYGPSVAEPKPSGGYNFGYLAIGMLNFTIRPRLSYWHPLLSSWEDVRPPNISVIQHEDSWSQNVELRDDLTQMGRELHHFTQVMAMACNVPDLTGAITHS